MAATYKEPFPRGPSRNGAHGGDRQASESWSRRFVRKLPRALFAVIDVDIYLVQDDDGPVTLERETNYTLCTNPRRPGETEEWVDIRYSPVDWQGTPTERDARAACAAVKARELTWDGRPFH